jgi:hypothetical protein
MRFRIGALIILLTAFALAQRTANADSIPVENNSFGESPVFTTGCGTDCQFGYTSIVGWATTGATGVFEPGGYFNSIPGGGNVIGFTNGGTLSQDLGVTLLPDTTYTLSVWVGDRPDLPGTYTIALDAGAALECSTSGSATAIPAGTFADETCSFTTGATPPAGDLTIWLTGTSAQADFADVSVATPEPSSILMAGAGLVGVALFGMLYKRKQSLQGMAS